MDNQHGMPSAGHWMDLDVNGGRMYWQRVSAIRSLTSWDWPRATTIRAVAMLLMLGG